MPPDATSASERAKRNLLEIVIEDLRRGDLLALFWELVRFGWVGFFTLGMYAVEMWALARLTDWPTWLNATLSYGPCLVTNYVLHRRFTFRSERDHMVAGPRYLVIQLGGMAINTGVIWLGEWLHFPYFPSQVAAIVLLALWSYLGQKLWTFS
jgi:putative flippase GtrA